MEGTPDPPPPAGAGAAPPPAPLDATVHPTPEEAPPPPPGAPAPAPPPAEQLRPEEAVQDLAEGVQELQAALAEEARGRSETEQELAAILQENEREMHALRRELRLALTPPRRRAAGAPEAGSGPAGRGDAADREEKWKGIQRWAEEDSVEAAFQFKPPAAPAARASPQREWHQQLCAVKGKLRELEQELQRKDASLRALQDDLGAAQRGRAEAEHKATEHTQSLTSLRFAKQQAKEALQQVRGEVAPARADLAEARAGEERERAAAADLAAGVAARDRELQDKDAALAAARREIEALQAGHAQEAARGRALEAGLGEAKSKGLAREKAQRAEAAALAEAAAAELEAAKQQARAREAAAAKKLQKLKQGFAAEKRELEAAAADLERASGEERRRREAAEADGRTAERRLRAAGAEVSALQGELELVKASLAARDEEMMRKIEEAEAGQLEDENRRLQGRVEELEEARAAGEAHRRAQARENRELDAARKALEQERDAARGDADRARADVGTLRADKEELSAVVAKLRGSKLDGEEREAQLQGKLDYQASEIKSLSARLKGIENLHRSTMGAIDDRNKVEGDLRAQLKAVQDLHSGVQAHSRQLEDRVARLTREVEAGKAALAARVGEAEAAAASRDRAARESGGLAEELAVAKRGVARLQAELKDLAAESESKAFRIKELTHITATVTQTNETLIRDTERTAEENRSLALQLGDAKQRMKHMTQKLGEASFTQNLALENASDASQALQTAEIENETLDQRCKTLEEENLRAKRLLKEAEEEHAARQERGQRETVELKRELESSIAVMENLKARWAGVEHEKNELVEALQGLEARHAREAEAFRALPEEVKICKGREEQVVQLLSQVLESFRDIVDPGKLGQCDSSDAIVLGYNALDIARAVQVAFETQRWNLECASVESLTFQEELGECRKRLAELEEDHAKRKADAARSEQAHAGELHKVKEYIGHLKAEKASYERKLEKAIAAAKDIDAHAQQSVKKVQASAEESAEKLSKHFQAKLAEGIQQASAYKATCDKYAKEVRARQEKCQEYEKVIERLKAKLDAQGGQLAEATRQAEETGTARASLETDNKHLSDRQKLLRTQLKNFTTREQVLSDRAAEHAAASRRAELKQRKAEKRLRASVVRRTRALKDLRVQLLVDRELKRGEAAERSALQSAVLCHGLKSWLMAKALSKRKQSEAAAREKTGVLEVMLGKSEMRIKQLERELERAGHARQVAHDKEVGKAKADLQRERLYVKQLKAELAEHNTEVAARNTESLKQLQDAEAALRESQNVASKLQGHVAEQNEILASYKAEMATLRDAVVAERERAASTDATLQEVTHTLTSASDAAARTDGEKQALEQDKASLAQEADRLRQDLAAATGALEEKRGRFEALVTELAEAKAAAESAGAELASARAARTEHEEDSRHASEKIASLEATIDAKVERIKELRASLSNALKQQAKAEKVPVAVKVAVAPEGGESPPATGVRERTAAWMECSTQTEATEAPRERAPVTESGTQTVEVPSEKDGVIASLRAEKERLIEQVQEAQSEAVGAEFDQAAQIKEFATQVNDANSALQVAEAVQGELQQQLDTVEKKRKEEGKALEQEVAGTRERLEISESMLEAAESTIQELEHETLALKSRCSALEMELEDWKQSDAAREAEPVRAEPVRAEPVRAEPVRAEPVRAEPVRAEPVQA